LACAVDLFLRNQLSKTKNPKLKIQKGDYSESGISK